MRDFWVDVSVFLNKIKPNLHKYHIIPLYFKEKPKVFKPREYNELLDTSLKHVSIITVNLINEFKEKELNCIGELYTVTRLIPLYKTRQKTTRSGKTVKIAKRVYIVDFPVSLFVIFSKSLPYEILAKSIKICKKYSYVE